MEVPDPQIRGEMLATYQHLRGVGRRLNGELVESLDRKAIDEAGRRLGILKRGTLYFDTEDTISVLMDYAIRHVRRDGLNAIERYLQDSPPPPDSDEMTFLQAIRPVRYSLFRTERVIPDFGLQLHDVLRDEPLLLIDVSFSRTADRGFVMASHVLSLGDFWMSSGAALPVTADFFERLDADIRRQFGQRPEDFRALSRDRETELATMIIRACLRAGMSERVAYADAGSAHHVPASGHRHPAHAVPPPKGLRIGRNEPCPCGSGRKYKNCCRRQEAR